VGGTGLFCARRRVELLAVAGAKETIGARIRRLRKQAGLSQRALAGPGISYAYISLVERDERTPSHKALRVIARTLGTTAEYLETGVELSARELRELRLSEAELKLRLEGEVEQAEDELDSILAEALEVGDRRSALRARVGLGFAAAHRGAHEQAITLLEQVVGEEGVSPLTHPDVYLTLGNSYLAATELDRAVELWRSSLEQIERAEPGNDTAYVRFATYLSYALSDRGDLAGAQRAIADALERAGSEADPYTSIRLTWSQARLALIEGSYREAQQKMQRAIALLETTEDSFYLARAHLLQAEMLLASGDASEAGEHLDTAERLFGGRAERQDEAWLLVERGKRAARLGAGADAIASGQQALELLGDDDPGMRGRARWAIAEGLAAEGQIDEALAHFREAETLLVNENRVSIQLLESWGKALSAAGRSSEAYEVTARALVRAGHVTASA
jgi:tetratricopeptide (TPR) repeat protein